MKDKIGQNIEIGQWIMRGRMWGRSTASVEFGRVTRIGEKSIWIDGRECRNPQLCIIVPEIVANFWTVLK